MVWYRDPSGHLIESTCGAHKLIYCGLCNRGHGRLYAKSECQGMRYNVDGLLVPVKTPAAEIARRYRERHGTQHRPRKQPAEHQGNALKVSTSGACGNVPYCPICIRHLAPLGYGLFECQNCGYVLTRAEIKQTIQR